MRIFRWSFSLALIGPSLLGSTFSLIDSPRILVERRTESISPKIVNPITRLTFKFESARADAIVKISQGETKIATIDIPKAEPKITPAVSTDFTVAITTLTGLGTTFRVELLDGEQVILKDVVGEWIAEVENFVNADKPLLAAFRNCLNQSIATSSGKCTIRPLVQQLFGPDGNKSGLGALLSCRGTPAEVLFKHLATKRSAAPFTYNNQTVSRISFGSLSEPMSSQCTYDKKNEIYGCFFVIDLPCELIPDLAP